MNIPEGFKQVTKEEFYNSVGKLDVHPRPTGEYPYITLWKDRSQGVVGWSYDGVYAVKC